MEKSKDKDFLVMFLKRVFFFNLLQKREKKNTKHNEAYLNRCAQNEQQKVL